jgi:glycerate-2-kinase
MMTAALKILRGCNVSGILIAPKGQKMKRLDDRVKVFLTGHPLPDSEGYRAGRHVLSALEKMREDEVLICLISGGASALLPAPVDSVSLADKRRLTEQLIRSRATIHEINTVRRHISALKGGRLAEKCACSTIISLIMSDVAGNPLQDIASGLTAPDPTYYRDAVQILRKHMLWARAPTIVKRHLKRGMAGKIPETPKPRSRIFKRVHNLVIMDNRHACNAAKNALQRKGLSTRILTSETDMDAYSLGKLLASIGTSSKSFREPINGSGAIIVGGETTVEVRGNGIGGRNQNTVLSALRDLEGADGLAIAAFGTDGVDGNSQAAGAIADGNSALRAHSKGLDPQLFLERNDSFNFFRKLNDNIVTGRTGTNVGDLYLLVSVH